MCELDNYRFNMQMNGGSRNDIWSLFGQVYNHPNFPDGHFVYVSTPTKLEGNVMTTTSGRTYLLLSPDGDENKIKAEINEVIKAWGYSRH